MKWRLDWKLWSRLADDLTEAVDKVTNEIKETAATANAHWPVLAQSRVVAPLTGTSAIVLELAGWWAPQGVPHTRVIAVSTYVASSIGHAGAVTLSNRREVEESRIWELCREPSLTWTEDGDKANRAKDKSWNSFHFRVRLVFKFDYLGLWGSILCFYRQWVSPNGVFPFGLVLIRWMINKFKIANWSPRRRTVASQSQIRVQFHERHKGEISILLRISHRLLSQDYESRSRREACWHWASWPSRSRTWLAEIDLELKKLMIVRAHPWPQL